jgi:N-acetylglucosaminyldiphosphoundecaprenol N-acetyl-beta-D-mannosaminyltransferase
MTYRGKKNVVGIMIDALDYEGAIDAIIQAAKERRGFAVSTAAVHAVMEGVLNPEHKFRLNHLDMITPDGQPVRWALNLLHGSKLRDRVYGPKLMLKLCARAEAEKLKIFFYGNTDDTLRSLRDKLMQMFPRLLIVGVLPSQFRKLSLDERDEIGRRIRDTGASIVIVGLGCPRQDIWSYEHRDILSVPIIAVGGAFGVIAGNVAQAPEWMQDRGLEWLYRFYCEPKRLWRRYIFLNPAYAVLVALQAAGLRKFRTEGRQPSAELRYG